MSGKKQADGLPTRRLRRAATSGWMCRHARAQSPAGLSPVRAAYSCPPISDRRQKHLVRPCLACATSLTRWRLRTARAQQPRARIGAAAKAWAASENAIKMRKNAVHRQLYAWRVALTRQSALPDDHDSGVASGLSERG